MIEDYEDLREEHIETLELVAKLNNWKSGIHRLDDSRLMKDLYAVVNNRVKQLNERILKLEELLNL